MCRWLIILVSFTCSPGLHAQGLQPRIHAAWGTNFLTSPGTDLATSPGRSGYFGASISIGSEGGKITFHPALGISAAAYRTRMAYRIHFVSQRTSVDLDLLMGIRQLNRTILMAGIFAGRVTAASASIEQKARDVIYGNAYPVLHADHHAHDLRAGVILGMAIPLGRTGRWMIDLRVRQHAVPLVNDEQFHQLIFEAEQLVLSTNTRPTEITFGLNFGLGKASTLDDRSE